MTILGAKSPGVPPTPVADGEEATRPQVIMAGVRQ